MVCNAALDVRYVYLAAFGPSGSVKPEAGLVVTVGSRRTLLTISVEAVAEGPPEYKPARSDVMEASFCLTRIAHDGRRDPPCPAVESASWFDNGPLSRQVARDHLSLQSDGQIIVIAVETDTQGESHTGPRQEASSATLS